MSATFDLPKALPELQRMLIPIRTNRLILDCRLRFRCRKYGNQKPGANYRCMCICLSAKCGVAFAISSHNRNQQRTKSPTIYEPGDADGCRRGSNTELAL